MERGEMEIESEIAQGVELAVLYSIIQLRSFNKRKVEFKRLVMREEVNAFIIYVCKYYEGQV